METKIFLDTNILIDYLLENRQKHTVAREIISQCYKGAIQGCISQTVFTNTAYVIRKMLNQTQLNYLFSWFCSFLEVLGVSTSIVVKACDTNKNDLEDATLFQIAH